MNAVKRVLPLFVLSLCFCLGAHAAEVKDCNQSPVKMSICQIEMMLEHAQANYDMAGGGGIGAIRQTATNQWEMSVLQEGRADLFIYSFKVMDNGRPALANVKTDTKSY